MSLSTIIISIIMVIGLSTVEAFSWSYIVFNHCRWIKWKNLTDRRNVSYRTIGLFSITSGIFSLICWGLYVYYTTLPIGGFVCYAVVTFIVFAFQLLTIHTWYMIASVVSIPKAHLPYLSKVVISFFSFITNGRYFHYVPVEERSNIFAYNSKSLLDNFLDVVPDMIWVKDDDNRYMYANPTTCKYLLLTNIESVIGKTNIEIGDELRKKGIDYTFGDLCFDSDEETKRTKHPTLFYEYGTVGGQYKALRVLKAPIMDLYGKVEGTIGMARNVTLHSDTYDKLEELFRSGRTDEGISLFLAYKQKYTSMRDIKHPVNFKHGIL